MPTTRTAPSLLPIALQLQKDLKLLCDGRMPMTAFPDPMDLLSRCSGVEGRVPKLVRFVRDLTHLTDFERKDGTTYVNVDHKPGYAIPMVSTDTNGRLIMSSEGDHLAFAMVCTMSTNWRYTKTRGYNELMALENVIRRLPSTMVPAWDSAARHLHAAFDPASVLSTFGGVVTITGGAIAVALHGLESLLTTLSADEAAYLHDKILRAAA